jgi:VWFA-related protein
VAEFASTVARAITARGMTAIYDGLLEGLERVQSGTHTRQVLILVSDGGDNASKAGLEDVIQKVRESDAVIYSVALTDSLLRDGNPKLLRRLAEATGGESFRPRSVEAVPEALEHIARDISSAYTLAYVPTQGAGAQASERRRRSVRVYVRGEGGRVYRVRTREGYFEPSGGAGR